MSTSDNSRDTPDGYPESMHAELLAYGRAVYACAERGPAAYPIEWSAMESARSALHDAACAAAKAESAAEGGAS